MEGERVRWLRDNTLFESLPEAVLEAIAAVIQVDTVPEKHRLILEDTAPTDFYILRSGRLESYCTNHTLVANSVSLLPGSVFPLKELLLDQPTEQTVITLSDCVLWKILRQDFLQLVEQYPEISQTFSRQLAIALDQVSAQLIYERERQAVLRPYLVPKVKRGIVGTSRYAVRHRQEIRKASGDRASVLIFGEPGLEKDNTAALIHFGSSDRHQPLIKVNCDTLQATGADLFGRVGKPGLLEWLGTGSLMLNNLQDLPLELQQKLVTLLETGEYTPIAREGETPPTPRRSEARILMNSERVLPALERKGLVGHVIKLSPLRVRKADIITQVEYYLSLLCRSRGVPKPTITPEAIRRLQGYDFPGNLAELQAMVERAVIQLNGSNELTEEVFWATSPKSKRFRLNLLNGSPQLRHFLRSPWFPDRLNYRFTVGAFAIVVANFSCLPLRGSSVVFSVPVYDLRRSGTKAVAVALSP
jgi:transcriptional regulator with AAA-type ATPase domain